MKSNQKEMIAVGKLFVSEAWNMRNAKHVCQEKVETLAVEILALGLMQNLTGYKEKNKRKRATGRVGVCDGGYRTRALELLLSRGQIDAELPVEVLIVPEEDAVMYSLMGNQYEPPHPADEYAAFRQLAEQGRTPEAIAAVFNVAPTVVKSRLKLANLAPMFIELFSNDEIEMEQLMALTLSDDHATQELVWENTGPYHDVHSIKKALTADEVSPRNAVAQFVGIDAYLAAGGQVRVDLFNQDQANGYLQNPQLLESLARDKLRTVAESLAPEFAWVEIHPSFAWDLQNQYAKARIVELEMTDETQTAYDALETKCDDLSEERDSLDEEAEDYAARCAALSEEESQVRAEMDAICNMHNVMLRQDAIRCGAVVTLNNQGGVVVLRDRLKPGARMDIEQDGDEDHNDDDASDSTAAAPKVKPVHSAPLIRQLTAHRTAAMQAVLCTRPDVALVTLVHKMALSIFYGEGSASALQITISRPALLKVDDDLKNSRALAQMSGLHSAWEARLPKESDGLFAWLSAEPQSVVLELLAYCTATGIDTVQSEETISASTSEISKACALDMADWWQPTGEGYFNRVPMKHAVSIVASAISQEIAGPMHALKKRDMTVAAENTMRDSRWLPAVLQTS